MYHAIENCEKCEWICQTEERNNCLLKNKAVGLLETCDRFKEKRGEHITIID